MKESKSDRRTRYTKMVIREAFLELMKESPLSKITVTEICKLADLNRGTFYTYYTDAYDLMDQIEHELYDEVNGTIQKSLRSGTPSDMLIEILTYIKDNNALCKILLGPNGDMDFVRNLINMGRDKNIEEWRQAEPGASAEELELIYIFISNGIVGIVENWIAGGTQQSPKEIGEFIAQLISRCLCLHMGRDLPEDGAR